MRIRARPRAVLVDGFSGPYRGRWILADRIGAKPLENVQESAVGLREGILKVREGIVKLVKRAPLRLPEVWTNLTTSFGVLPGGKVVTFAAGPHDEWVVAKGLIGLYLVQPIFLFLSN